MFTKVVTKNSIQVVLSFTAAHTYSHYSVESMIIVFWISTGCAKIPVVPVVKMTTWRIYSATVSYCKIL